MEKESAKLRKARAALDRQRQELQEKQRKFQASKLLDKAAAERQPPIVADPPSVVRGPRRAKSVIADTAPAATTVAAIDSVSPAAAAADPISESVGLLVATPHDPTPLNDGLMAVDGAPSALDEASSDFSGAPFVPPLLDDHPGTPPLSMEESGAVAAPNAQRRRPSFVRKVGEAGATAPALHPSKGRACITLTAAGAVNVLARHFSLDPSLIPPACADGHEENEFDVLLVAGSCPTDNGVLCASFLSFSYAANFFHSHLVVWDAPATEEHPVTWEPMSFFDGSAGLREALQIFNGFLGSFSHKASLTGDEFITPQSDGQIPQFPPAAELRKIAAGLHSTVNEVLQELSPETPLFSVLSKFRTCTFDLDKDAIRPMVQAALNF